MAGYMNNYRSYRGKTPKWKVLLAVVLVLVIIASLAFIRLQNYIIYDESGTPHLWMPEKETESVTASQPPAALVVEEVPEPEVVTVEYLAAAPVQTEAQAQELLTAARKCDGVILPLKGEEGLIYFRCASAVSGSVQASDETAQAIAAVVSSESHTAARLTCFLDPKATRMDARGMALLNKSGYLFYDGSNRCWLDPGKEKARTYLCSLAAEAAQLGFDELILANAGYPTAGNLENIRYGETAAEENLTAFFRELTDALEPYGTALTIEMSTEGILSGSEGELPLTLAVQYASRIIAEVESEGDIEALSAAVAAANGETVFVPILTQAPTTYQGSYILRQTA